ncbi:hypothetical protein WMY93_032351 [Mugilogobius chulae]|uniref:Uncharacterized protein n=1 Tax=Mugilogobius chulae TaxID=88201 RepID=A0AAW0MPG2_9GOBI
MTVDSGLALRGLRALVQERLTAAVDELFGNVQKTFSEYEQEIRRQRKLLDLLCPRRAAPRAGDRSSAAARGETLQLTRDGRYNPGDHRLCRPGDGRYRPGDGRYSPGEKHQSFCAVTVKTEEPDQIRVHSPVQGLNGVQSRFETRFKQDHLCLFPFSSSLSFLSLSSFSPLPLSLLSSLLSLSLSLLSPLSLSLSPLSLSSLSLFLPPSLLSLLSLSPLSPPLSSSLSLPLLSLFFSPLSLSLLLLSLSSEMELESGLDLDYNQFLQLVQDSEDSLDLQRDLRIGSRTYEIQGTDLRDPGLNQDLRDPGERLTIGLNQDLRDAGLNQDSAAFRDQEESGLASAQNGPHDGKNDLDFPQQHAAPPSFSLTLPPDWLQTFQIPWDRAPPSLSLSMSRGERADTADRRAFVRVWWTP